MNNGEAFIHLNIFNWNYNQNILSPVRTLLSKAVASS